MPKLRPTGQQNRELILMCALARACAEGGLDSDREVADRIGITPRQFAYRKEQKFQGMSICDFGRMARRLHLTGREVCEALGVPYSEEEKEGEETE